MSDSNSVAESVNDGANSTTSASTASTHTAVNGDSLLWGFLGKMGASITKSTTSVPKPGDGTVKDQEE